MGLLFEQLFPTIVGRRVFDRAGWLSRSHCFKLKNLLTRFELETSSAILVKSPKVRKHQKCRGENHY